MGSFKGACGDISQVYARCCQGPYIHVGVYVCVCVYICICAYEIEGCHIFVCAVYTNICHALSLPTSPSFSLSIYIFV